MRADYDNRPLKVKASITLDESVLTKVKELAEQQDRSFSQYINLVLKRHLEAVDRKTTKKEEPGRGSDA